MYFYLWPVKTIIINSGAPAARRAAKRSPILITGNQKKTRELIFLWLSWLAVLLVGAYARRDDDDGVAQHGGQTGQTPKKRQPWFTVYFVDIGHPYYNQLTPVKARYPLTGIT